MKDEGLLEAQIQLTQANAASVTLEVQDKKWTQDAEQMVKGELIARLGVIAQSGTKSTKDCLADALYRRDLYNTMAVLCLENGHWKMLSIVEHLIEQVNRTVEYYTKALGDSVGDIQVVEATPEIRDAVVRKLYGLA